MKIDGKLKFHLRKSHLIFGALGFFLIGLVWIVGSTSSLIRSINPSSGIMLSKSLEPVEISLRYGFEKNGTGLPRVGSEAYEWRLSIPRAYIWYQLGTNGSVFRGDIDRFSTGLATLADGGLKELSPEILVSSDGKQRNNYSIDIYLHNYRARQEIVKGSFCVREDDYSAFMKERGTYESLEKCESLRCNIYTHLDGWDVELSVLPTLYNSPKKACELATSFLSKMTIKRDSIK